MGLYDREYGRGERTPWDRIENPRSMVVVLIVINVVVFLVDLITTTNVPGGGRDSFMLNWFGLHEQSFIRPWRWYETLTYGFLHNQEDILHILFNMFLLYVFGRAVEQRIGGQEFLKFYLAAVIVGGIVALVLPWLMMFLTVGGWAPQTIGGVTLGASGAVVATLVLFAQYYPNQEILFLFIFPMKAWVLALLIVAMDMLGALGILGGAGSATAFEVHLAGAAFGFLYGYRNWSFRRLDLESLTDLPQRLRQRSRRAKLRVHDPDKKIQRESEEADRILAKIHEQGEASLTTAERRTLQRYSQRQRAKREMR